jgi:hypothetical protein
MKPATRRHIHEQGKQTPLLLHRAARWAIA